jgi:putative phage-type endonuclease
VSTAIEIGRDVGPAGRDDWLAARRGGVGASDLPAILGMHPRRTALGCYMEKTGQAAVDDAGDDETLEFGLAAEPLIARMYGFKTGRPIARTQVFCRAEGDSPPAFATLDGVTDEGRIVEFKTIKSHNREMVGQLGEPGTDEVPEPWIAQTHFQMYVADRDEADVAVLVHGEVRIYTVRRTPKLLDHYLERARAFWRLVESRTPPPPSSPEDCRHLAVLYREARGEVELADSVAVAATEYEELGSALRFCQKQRDTARLALLQALGPADVGRLPDGRIVRRSVVEVKAHEVKASTQVRLTIKGGG